MAEEKLSIVTDEISQDFEVVAKFLKEFDIRAIEIRTAGGERVPRIEERIWEDIKMRARNEGWKIIALSPGIFKGDYRDEERIGSELEIGLSDTIGRAIDIGAEYIVTFGFMYDREHPDMEAPDYIVGALKHAAELCHSADIKLLLENEPGSFANTGERTKKILERIGQPNMFANWDPCNSNVFDASGKLASSATVLGDMIRHVHVKDACPIPDELFPKYGPISQGHVGWRDHLLALKEIGFDGYFGIETHFEPLYESSAILVNEFRMLLSETDYYGDVG